MRESRHAPRRRLSREPPRRARPVPRRRARRRRDPPSRLRRVRPAHRGAVRGGRGRGRRDHLRRSGHRQADRRDVADPALRGRSRTPAGRPPVLGRGLVRPHGAHARPRGLGAHRLRGLAPALRPRGPPVRRQRGPVLREGAGRGPLPGLRDRPAPDRSHDAGPSASGALPAPGGVEGDGRGHRDPWRALDRHGGDHGRLALRELHHPARARATSTTRSRSWCR